MPAPTIWKDQDYAAVAAALEAFTTANPGVLLVAPKTKLSSPPAFTTDPGNPARIAGWDLVYDQVKPITFGDDPPYREGRILLSGWVEPHGGGTAEAAREAVGALSACFVGISKVGGLNLLEITPAQVQSVSGWHVETDRLNFIGA